MHLLCPTRTLLVEKTLDTLSSVKAMQGLAGMAKLLNYEFWNAKGRINQGEQMIWLLTSQVRLCIKLFTARFQWKIDAADSGNFWLIQIN